MSVEPDLYYFCQPTGPRPVPLPVEFVTAQAFLADEPACQDLWEFAATQFRTRSKFLAVWRGVSYVAFHRDGGGRVGGLLLVTAAVNWQIDYVVVSPASRGRGVASALVTETVNQAAARGVPYVMLTSKESLRRLYEGCGFVVVGGQGIPSSSPLPSV